MCAGSAFATEWNVSTVAALTNAVTQAMPGDRIILAQGKYTFTDEWMLDDGTGKIFLVITNDNITIEGAVSTPRSTWTDHDEPVIIDGNGVGAIIKADQDNRPSQGSARNRLTLKHITFTGATYRGAAFAQTVKVANYDFIKCTNCVFRQNTVAGADVTAVLNWGELRDCLVTNNILTASNQYVVRNANAYGCDFVGNIGRLFDAVSSYGCNVILNDCSSLSTYLYTRGYGSMNLVCSNCVFRCNRSNYEMIGSANRLMDCLFECNTNTVNGAQYSGKDNAGVAENCTFRGNVVTSLESYLTTGFKSLSRCTIEENRTGKGMVYLNASDIDAVAEGCTFVSNRLYNRGEKLNGGAGIRVMRETGKLCSMLVTNCTFKWNYQQTGGYTGGAICATNGVPGEAPWGAVTAINCTFASNTASKASGVRGVYAKNCQFAGNSDGALNNFYGTAWYSRLEDCDIHGGGLVDCVVNRCRIHDAPQGGVDERGVFCVFAGRTSATNCLVERCIMNEAFGCLYLVGTGYRMDAEFVNCTFATNRMYTYRVDGNCLETNGTRFVNCLFNGNFNRYAASDVGICTSSEAHLEWLGLYSFTNTYYKTYSAAGNSLTAAHLATLTNAPNTLALCVDPKFSKDKYPDTPYWSLMYNSPLVGAGDPLDFTDADLDLAGRLRVRDGKIDVGCYQCWLWAPGLIIKIL